MIQIKILGFNLIKLLVKLYFRTEGNSVTSGEQFSLWSFYKATLTLPHYYFNSATAAVGNRLTFVWQICV